MVKRVSTDEKVERILAFFKNTSDIYTIKELEKRLPKECGISAMLVTDLIKKMCDEDIISMEKCGSMNFYWCFPMQKQHAAACEIEKLSAAIEEYKVENSKKKAQLEKMQELKKDTPERRAISEKYEMLKKKMEEIEREKKQIEECPIDEYRKFVDDIGEMSKIINKTTDDIFSLQSYVCKKFCMDRKDFNRNFGIDDEMDYFED